MKRFLFYLVQWTWGLPQNVVGLLLFLINRKNGSYPFHLARVVKVKGNFSTSLGMFLLLGMGNGNEPLRENWEKALLTHEYGHTMQSLLLGPFYFIAVGLPSVIWARHPYFHRLRERKHKSYFAVWPEKSANRLGAKATGILPPQ